jgi:putative solute:sodium symporter small subunit
MYRNAIQMLRLMLIIYLYQGMNIYKGVFMTKEEYWNTNIKLIIKTLIIWFVVSYLCGIILVDVLNTIQLGGYKLGFWFAQQGAIYVFVGLIFWYASKIATLDEQYNKVRKD